MQHFLHAGVIISKYLAFTIWKARKIFIKRRSCVIVTEVWGYFCNLEISWGRFDRNVAWHARYVRGQQVQQHAKRLKMPSVYRVSQDNQQTKITPTTGFPHFVSLEAASSCCMVSESFPWPSRTGNYDAKHKCTPTERETKPKPLNPQITLQFSVHTENTSGRKKKRSMCGLFFIWD